LSLPNYWPVLRFWS